MFAYRSDEQTLKPLKSDFESDGTVSNVEVDGSHVQIRNVGMKGSTEIKIDRISGAYVVTVNKSGNVKRANGSCQAIDARPLGGVQRKF